MPNEFDLRFAKAMGAMSAAFGSQMTNEKMAIYFDMLKEFGIEKIESAVRTVIKEKRSPGLPTIGEIRAKITGGGYENLLRLADCAWEHALHFIDGGLDAWVNSNLDPQYAPMPAADKAICSLYGSWTEFTYRLEQSYGHGEHREFIDYFVRRQKRRMEEDELTALPEHGEVKEIQ